MRGRLPNAPPGQLTDAERAEFERAMQGAISGSETDAPEPGARESGDEFERAVRALPEQLPKPPPRRAPPPSAATVLRRLRNGSRNVPEISVRQMTRAAARPRIESFLRSRREAGCQAVKVVHGKGRGSPGGRSVLRERVPEWLASWKPELVEAWEVTPEPEGGAGALFVALAPRRSR